MTEKSTKSTWMLKYEVIGKICPRGMTAENCHLRKVLNNWQAKYGFGGSGLGFGYKILENGNLLVPKWFCTGNESGDAYFDLKKVIDETCQGACYRENREKELANPEEFKKLPEMQTVIFAYQTSGVNFCPRNCQLCDKLAEMQEKHAIGYQKLGENILMMPDKHYDSKDNVYRDISKMSNEICDECRGFSR